MKIVTVIGARPQFIKAAMVSRKIRSEHEEILVHTGQHFDDNMSKVFFDEMDIPEPDYNLNINGKAHGAMTGEMLIAIEGLLKSEKPDMLLVYGDTNSTLAGALAAVKLHIPVCHVEAGNRLNTLSNPEEINRLLTDHMSSLLLCAVESSVDLLKKENIIEGVYFVGDPMYDAFLYYSRKNIEDVKLTGHDKASPAVPDKYYYLTCHREENTQKDETLLEILSAMEELDAPTVYPVHPRNRNKVIQMVERMGFGNILAVEPVKYSDSITLVRHAKKIVTDSGGVQREAFFAGVQCVTIFDNVVWPETMVENRNQLASPDKEDILTKLRKPQTVDESYMPFGDGHSGEKIVEAIDVFLRGR